MRAALAAAVASLALISASMLATPAITRHRCEVVPIAGRLAQRCDTETTQGNRVTFYRQTVTPYERKSK